MGGSKYNDTDMKVRTSLRSATASARGIPFAAAAFAYDTDIKSGVAAAKVHKTLNPHGVTRESRDSKEHPVSIPIAIFLDTTGSMSRVPVMIQEKLSHLMGCFLDDKASGKRYLGDGYPAILIGAVDDYNAQEYCDHEGTLQVSQFESGIEIDDSLTNLWLTGAGGGTYSENYEMAMYFTARHTVHDHWDKRGRKGYCFIIGDENPYPHVRKDAVAKIIGDTIQDNIPTKEIVEELKQRYHVFMIIPGMTSHFNDPALEKAWVELLGQQNVVKLADPNKICECIVSAVAISEEHVGLADLDADMHIGADLSGALVPLSKSSGSGLSKHSASGLQEVAGTAGGTERL